MCVWIKSRFLMIFNNEWMNECRVCFGTIGYFLQSETKNIHSCYTKIISTEKQTDFFFCFTQVENMAFFSYSFLSWWKKTKFSVPVNEMPNDNDDDDDSILILFVVVVVVPFSFSVSFSWLMMMSFSQQPNLHDLLLLLLCNYF